MFENMFEKIKKIPIKHIIIIIVTIAAMVAAAKMLQQWVAENQETVSLPTPAHIIYAGQVITPDNLTSRSYLKAAQEETSLTNISSIAGMVAATDLYPGEQIRVDKLLTPESVLNNGEAYVSFKAESLEQIIGGQIRPNLLVDIYHVEDKSYPPVILAKNAVISAITDDKGNLVPKGDNAVPKWVVLKVKGNEAVNFTKPLLGGKVLVAQVGIKSSVASESPKPKVTDRKGEEESGEQTQPEVVIDGGEVR
ncbi:SAF domain-containing protein [Desulfoscipio gibsoniae]